MGIFGLTGNFQSEILTPFYSAKAYREAYEKLFNKAEVENNENQ